MNAKLWPVVVLLLAFGSKASADCGYVNGQYVCPETPGCGLVNGAYLCSDPPSCGYVNGTWTCPVQQDEPTAAPAPAGIMRPRAGDADAENAGVVAGLEWVSSFFAGKGADDWMATAMSWMTKKLMLAYLETKLWSMQVAWSAAEGVLDSLGVFETILTRVEALPADARAALGYFGVLTALNMILTAAVAALALRFMPGL